MGQLVTKLGFNKKKCFLFLSSLVMVIRKTRVFTLLFFVKKKINRIYRLYLRLRMLHKLEHNLQRNELNQRDELEQ